MGCYASGPPSSFQNKTPLVPGMETLRATMAKAASAKAAPLHRGLPDEIVIWEILVCLPPKALLRCRAVCRTWRWVTSAPDFLLAHQGPQPYLPIICGYEDDGSRYHNILAFDHRAAGAQLQPVVRLSDSFGLETSCDGLLIVC